MTPLHPIDILRKKRDGLPLSPAEIEAFIGATVDASISDAQIAAFLMAVFQRGLSLEELAALTHSMRFSGETFDPTPLHSFLVDKHSTGGVGDKTSLLIAPILAAAGLAHPTPHGTPGLCVPMISGRSLGHTGGTLDKLESIPGFNTQLSLPRFLEVLRTCAAALIGQTPTLVPADRILYALRDHTATVESPDLICASIMSKKLAEGLDALVLDVKTGSGAFLRRPEDAAHLARLMVATGHASGTRTVALLTNHDEPLGRFAGNWLEVRECADLLLARRAADRHPLSADLLALTHILAGWMLHLAGLAPTPAAGALLSDEILLSGAAHAAWLNIVAAQGGDPALFASAATLNPVHRPGATRILHAPSSGFLHSMDCTQVGWAVQRLGAGRTTPGAPVSPHAGIELLAKTGHPLTAGQPLITLYADHESQLDEPCTLLQAALHISPTPPPPATLVRDILTTP